MIKNAFLALTLFLAFVQQSKAQENYIEKRVKTDHSWQAGIVISEVVVPNLSLEFGKFVHPKHIVGGRLSFYGAFRNTESNKVYSDVGDGIGLGLFHKVFLGNTKSEESKLFIRHSLRFRYYSLGRQNTGFDSTLVGGNWVYQPYNRFEYDGITQLGYAFALGHQWMFNDNIYIDTYLGLGYTSILNYNNLSAPKQQDFNSDDVFFMGANHWLYRGIRPIFGITIGWQQ